MVYSDEEQEELALLSEVVVCTPRDANSRPAHHSPDMSYKDLVQRMEGVHNSRGADSRKRNILMDKHVHNHEQAEVPPQALATDGRQRQK